MKSAFVRSVDQHPERGAVLVMVAISMVILVGFLALAMDLGYMFVGRNQVQNIADGSSLAGARTLGNIYQGLSQEQQQTFVCGDVDCVQAVRQAAQQVAGNNRAGGMVMSLQDHDVRIGRWDGEEFTETPNRPDAVLVIARRDGENNGPISTFFARVLGIDEVSVNAVAVAAMTGQGTAAEGEVELPIGISRWFFDMAEGEEDRCNDYIKFYPANDPESCAGWTSWNLNSNDNNLRKILRGEDDSPETLAYDTHFNFIGGAMSNPTFDALLTLFQERGYATDANHNFLLDNGAYVSHPPNPDMYYDVDVEGGERSRPVQIWEVENSVQAKYPNGDLRYMHRWDTTVPVYDRDDCSNPNQSIRIDGFARVELTDVLDAPDKMVRGKVICEVVSTELNRGGGGNFGVKGPIPGLVR